MAFALGVMASVAVGLALGLVGGGGGILTVPVLTYLFGIPASQATGASLLVVGLTAAVGAIEAWRLGDVDHRAGLNFAVPSFLGVFVARRWAMPAVPETVLGIGKDHALMLAFSALLVFAGLSMLRDRPERRAAQASQLTVGLLGLGVGLVAGFLGAGGGFLIVPVLALLGGLPMKRAVGTSLMVVSFQSLLGFAGEGGRASAMPWPVLASVAAAALVGLGLGRLWSRRVSGSSLRPGFAWFVLTMALVITVVEVRALTT
jgi:uncharacterized protein